MAPVAPVTANGGSVDLVAAVIIALTSQVSSGCLCGVEDRGLLDFKRDPDEQ